MTMRQNESSYFGYIVRIIDDENNNIDLIYNYQSVNNNRFELVFGEQLTNKSLMSNFGKLSSEWVDIELKYDYRKQALQLICLDTTLTAIPIKLTKKIKILFGASDYDRFKTTDVPPMNLRDVKLFLNNRLIHEWPLNESAGNIAFDVMGNMNALATNPDWLKPKFQDWKKLLDVIVAGKAEIAFNSMEEKIYLIGEEQLIVFSINGNTADTINYKNKPSVLKSGCQAFFDGNSNKLVSYNVDLKTISTFDLQSGIWDQSTSQAYPLTIYWHHNKYFSTSDHSLYIFGGYGQHEYKKSVYRYSFPGNHWDTLKTRDDDFHPRYLAAMGYLNDTVYILGGYGSLSGKQIMNPQFYNDLVAFSLNNNNFVRSSKFHPPIEDIAYANSMIIDPDGKEFYALAFPIFKYDSYLQLLKGKLYDQEMQLVGNKIPYSFHDILSFADLFYSKSTGKLICVTLLNTENNQTQAKIFAIGYPPSPITLNPDLSKNKYFYLIIFLIFIIPAIGFFVFWIFKNSRKNKTDYAPGNQDSSFNSATVKDYEDFTNELQLKNSILFFGDFQIIDKQGADITHKFSHLLKELFLLIWLYTIKNKGISSEKIIELLWFDKDEKSAKNNLAVNIAKLKIILSDLETVKLTKYTGYWKINFNDEIVYNDYWNCKKAAIIRNHLQKDQIYEIIRITQKGHFLESSVFEWLDEFKAEISNIIIDTLMKFTEKIDLNSESDLILHLTDTILNFEILNEEAMQLKCKALIHQGKHNLAKEAYSKFVRDYQTLYNARFEKTFIEFIN